MTTKPQRCIDDALLMGRAIECTSPEGVTHSFVPAGVDGLFVARETLQSGSSETWVINPSIEETIHNAIQRCEPDVKLVKKNESVFAGEGPDDA